MTIVILWGITTPIKVTMETVVITTMNVTTHVGISGKTAGSRKELSLMVRVVAPRRDALTRERVGARARVLRIHQTYTACMKCCHWSQRGGAAVFCALAM